jgi:hypothetical protein
MLLVGESVVAGGRGAELTMRVRPISSMPRDLASTLTRGVLLSDHYGERRAMADVMTFLDEAGLEFEALEHAHTERAADEAAALGVSSTEVAKTLVLTAPEDNVRAGVVTTSVFASRPARALSASASATAVSVRARGAHTPLPPRRARESGLPLPSRTSLPPHDRKVRVEFEPRPRR